MRGGHQTTSNNRKYDAGIVLVICINNVKTARQYKSATLNTGQPHTQRRTEPAEQQPASIRFPNQMIEQINIALEQKGQEFLSLGH